MKEKQTQNNTQNVQRNLKHGFTLLELLVVVIIIGILAAIALPQYRRAIGKAELSGIISVVKIINNAQDRYYLLHNNYADSINSLDINWNKNNNIKCFVSSKRWTSCYSKNYGFIHYYSSNLVECYSKNKKLSTPCQEFLNKKTGQSMSNGSCDEIGANPCWRIINYMPM